MTKHQIQSFDGEVAIGNALGQELREYLEHLIANTLIAACPGCNHQVTHGERLVLGINQLSEPPLRLIHAHPDCCTSAQGSSYHHCCKAELDERARQYWVHFGEPKAKEEEEAKKEKARQAHQEKLRKKSRRARLGNGKERTS